MNTTEIKLATSTQSSVRHPKRNSTYTLLQMLQTNETNPLTFKPVHKVEEHLPCKYKLKGEWIDGEVQLSTEGVWMSMWADVMAPQEDYIIYKDNVSGELYARQVEDFCKFDLVEEI